MRCVNNSSSHSCCLPFKQFLKLKKKKIHLIAKINIHKEIWHKKNLMNLHFNVDKILEENLYSKDTFKNSNEFKYFTLNIDESNQFIKKKNLYGTTQVVWLALK